MAGSRLVDDLAEAIAREEGYYVREVEARTRGIRWPTVAQRLKNPGNVRDWKGVVGGVLKRYPRKKANDSFYVDFSDPMFDDMPDEGWRVLKVLCQQYIDGRYTGGKSPTLLKMFEAYAPGSDGNHPRRYAESVANRLGVAIDRPMKEVQGEYDAR